MNSPPRGSPADDQSHGDGRHGCRDLPPDRATLGPRRFTARFTAGDEARASTWRQALSVGVATGAYGISFGAVGVASGLSLLQTCALSLLMFSGGSQFALAGVVVAGGGGLTAVVTPAFLGIRNAFYGLQMAPLLRARGWRRPLAVHLTIDESTAVGSAQIALHPDRPDLVRTGFWVTGVTVYLLWNLATLAGALAGQALGDPRRYGFDAAAAGAFLALLWPRLRAAGTVQVAVAAAVVATLALPLTPAGVPVLLAAAGSMLVAAGLSRRTRGRRPGNVSGTGNISGTGTGSGTGSGPAPGPADRRSAPPGGADEAGAS